MVADRGLRQGQNAGGFGKAAGFNDGQQRADFDIKHMFHSVSL